MTIETTPSGASAMTAERLERIHGRHSWSECKDMDCGGNFLCQSCGERVGWCLQGRDMNTLRCSECEEKGTQPQAQPVGRADYAARREKRIERLRTRATKKRAESVALEAGVRKIADMIPFGQPILIGHHSEKRARRDYKRIREGFEKSTKALVAAQELDRRASAAESNEAISSDNPEAVQELEGKLRDLKGQHARWKLIAAAVRKQNVTALVDLALVPDELQTIRLAAGGSVAWKASNLAAEIRRVAKRLDDLRKRAAQPPAGDVQIGECTIRDNDNRTQLIFSGKPPEEIRKLLKSHGFRWAPSEGAWQRHQSSGARYWAEHIARQAQGPESK